MVINNHTGTATFCLITGQKLRRWDNQRVILRLKHRVATGSGTNSAGRFVFGADENPPNHANVSR